MRVLAPATIHGTSAIWAEIKAAVARGYKRTIDARMNQIRCEIEMRRVHGNPPHSDGAVIIR